MNDRARAEPTHPWVTAGQRADEPVDPGLVDPDTGFATTRAFDEAVRHEDRRFSRYGHAVTVVVAELDGLGALAARLGPGAAERLVRPVAATLLGNARGADILARVGPSRFVTLMPETNEIAAINYVERVRAVCDTWLAAGAVSVRLAVGWAQPQAGGTLGDALSLADERMNGDRRRVGYSDRAVVGVPPGAPQDWMPVYATESLDVRPEAPDPDGAGSKFPSSVSNPSAPESGPASEAGLASARPDHFEAILADFLDHPEVTPSMPDRISVGDDEEP